MNEDLPVQMVLLWIFGVPNLRDLQVGAKEFVVNVRKYFPPQLFVGEVQAKRERRKKRKSGTTRSFLAKPLNPSSPINPIFVALQACRSIEPGGQNDGSGMAGISIGGYNPPGGPRHNLSVCRLPCNQGKDHNQGKQRKREKLFHTGDYFATIFPLDKPEWTRFNGLSNFCRPFE